jgi:serine/threonine-protein kinase
MGFVDDALRSAPNDERVGRVLGEKWTIVRLLGIGGMARVYEAHHRNGRKVAVKILKAELGQAPRIKERFLQEGLAANKVEHPAVVAVLDDGTTEDGAPYLVMEFLEGETLKGRVMRDGPLGEAQVLGFADTLLDALAAAHARGVLHRDLKPDNLFVTTAGELRVLDFGIARIAEQAAHATEPGVSMGTPAFMPPEQARGRWELVDARSDLWAVGATMYMLLSGQAPRRAATPNEELLLAMTAPVPPLVTARRVVSAKVAALVDRALAREPEARFADARAMQAAVRDASAALASGRAKRAMRLPVSLFGALLGAAILTAFFVARRHAPAQTQGVDAGAHCEMYARPSEAAGCHPPGGNQPNGCYGGYWCLTMVNRCVPAPAGCP